MSKIKNHIPAKSKDEREACFPRHAPSVRETCFPTATAESLGEEDIAP